MRRARALRCSGSPPRAAPAAAATTDPRARVTRLRAEREHGRAGVRRGLQARQRGVRRVLPRRAEAQARPDGPDRARGGDARGAHDVADLDPPQRPRRCTTVPPLPRHEHRFARETSRLAVYSPRRRARAAAAARANRQLDRRLSAATEPGDQADALRSFTRSLERCWPACARSRCRPCCARPTRTRSAGSTTTRSLAERLRRALVARTRRRWRGCSSASARTQRAGGRRKPARDAGVRGYKRRYRALSEAYADVQREQSRLDLELRDKADTGSIDGVSLTGPPPVSTNPLVRLSATCGRAARAGAVPAGRRDPSRAPHAPRDHRPARRCCWTPTSATARCSACACSARASCSCSGRRPTTASSSRTRADFTWRDGGFADLIPLLGDGLLTIDGEFHRRSRRIMLPAFHRERIAGCARDDGVRDRAGGRALARRRPRRPLRAGGGGWRCASRCGRCSASTPTGAARIDPAREFERALGYYGARVLAAGPARPAHAVGGADDARRASTA